MRGYIVAVCLVVLSALSLAHAMKAVSTKDLDQLARTHDVVVVFLYARS